MKTKLLSQITNPAIDRSIGTGNGGEALALLIANLWRTVIILGGLALLLYLVWGGIDWVLAGGDKTKIENARAKITQGIIGMAILSATVAIAIFLSEVLQLDLLNPQFFTPGN
jgi:hypothetical protein